MYVDKENLYSSAQAITSAVASTNIIDHQAIRDLGTGQDIYVVSICDVAMTDGSSDSTVVVTLETDDAEAFSTATTAQTIGTFGALSAIGTVVFAKLGLLNERFSRIKYTPGGGDLTTGSFTTFLTVNMHRWIAYAKGYTIS